MHYMSGVGDAARRWQPQWNHGCRMASLGIALTCLMLSMTRFDGGFKTTTSQRCKIKTWIRRCSRVCDEKFSRKSLLLYRACRLPQSRNPCHHQTAVVDVSVETACGPCSVRRCSCGRCNNKRRSWWLSYDLHCNELHGFIKAKLESRIVSKKCCLDGFNGGTQKWDSFQTSKSRIERKPHSEIQF